MKKLILTLGLFSLTIIAHAQGTIVWGNSTLTRIIIVPLGGTGFNPTAADGFSFTLYYGPAGSTADQLVAATPPAFIGGVPGILNVTPTVLPLPGTDSGDTVSVQVRATHPSGLPMINPPVRQITVGPPGGPGTVVWTIDPISRTFYIVPEPSTLAIGTLGALLILCTTGGALRRYSTPISTPRTLTSAPILSRPAREYSPNHLPAPMRINELNPRKS